MRLGRSRVATAESVALEDEHQSTSYEPASPQVPASAAGPLPTESSGHAILVLLEAGIIDVVESQAMRARISAATATP